MEENSHHKHGKSDGLFKHLVSSMDENFMNQDDYMLNSFAFFTGDPQVSISQEAIMLGLTSRFRPGDRRMQMKLLQRSSSYPMLRATIKAEIEQIITGIEIWLLHGHPTHNVSEQIRSFQEFSNSARSTLNVIYEGIDLGGKPPHFDWLLTTFIANYINGPNKSFSTSWEKILARDELKLQLRSLGDGTDSDRSAKLQTVFNNLGKKSGNPRDKLLGLIKLLQKSPEYAVLLDTCYAEIQYAVDGLEMFSEAHELFNQIKLLQERSDYASAFDLLSFRYRSIDNRTRNNLICSVVKNFSCFISKKLRPSSSSTSSLDLAFAIIIEALFRVNQYSRKRKGIEAFLCGRGRGRHCWIFGKTPPSAMYFDDIARVIGRPQDDVGVQISVPAGDGDVAIERGSPQDDVGVQISVPAGDADVDPEHGCPQDNVGVQINAQAGDAEVAIERGRPQDDVAVRISVQAGDADIDLERGRGRPQDDVGGINGPPGFEPSRDISKWNGVALALAAETIGGGIACESGRPQDDVGVQISVPAGDADVAIERGSPQDDVGVQISVPAGDGNVDPENGCPQDDVGIQINAPAGDADVAIEHGHPQDDVAVGISVQAGDADIDLEHGRGRPQDDVGGINGPPGFEPSDISKWNGIALALATETIGGGIAAAVSHSAKLHLVDSIIRLLFVFAFVVGTGGYVLFRYKSEYGKYMMKVGIWASSVGIIAALVSSLPMAIFCSVVAVVSIFFAFILSFL